MAREEALDAAERCFQILAYPLYTDGQKLMACLAFLRVIAAHEMLDEYPREYKAVVGGAFEHGATWQQVAEAAGIDVIEAKRRWADMATPDTPEGGQRGRGPSWIPRRRRPRRAGPS